MYLFNDTATTEIYTLSLHDASSDLTADQMQALAYAPLGLQTFGYGIQQVIYAGYLLAAGYLVFRSTFLPRVIGVLDRKSTRLNSSHANISYAVFCLKKNNYLLDHLS